MAQSVTNVSISTDTWQNLIDKVNTLANLLSTFVVTANNSANGSATSGNAFITGIFGANTLVAGTLRSGNVAGTGNGIVIDAPIWIGNTEYVDLSVTTSNTNAQVVDSFPVANNRTSKFLIQITSTGMGYHSTELMALHDGTNTYTTEYASLISNSSLGTFSSNVASGDFNLIFTPVNANNTLNIHRVSLAV